MSALVLVTWEMIRPLVGVTMWIMGDCQIIDTTGKIILPHLLSSIYFMSLAMFSISCMLVLFAYSNLSFLQLALGEFGLLELCRLTLFKFHIKVLRTKKSPIHPPLGLSILTTIMPKR
jgi:hypothetical protein